MPKASSSCSSNKPVQNISIIHDIVYFSLCSLSSACVCMRSTYLNIYRDVVISLSIAAPFTHIQSVMLDRISRPLDNENETIFCRARGRERASCEKHVQPLFNSALGNVDGQKKYVRCPHTHALHFGNDTDYTRSVPTNNC